MGKSKIMIVDDNRLILEVVGDYFEEAGFDVVKRDSALGTSTAVYEEQPDCILLDVNMPTLSGDEMVEMIRNSSKKDVKVILHSEQDEWDLKKLAEKTGADGFFKKSGNREVLLKMVQKAISPW